MQNINILLTKKKNTTYKFVQGVIKKKCNTFSKSYKKKLKKIKSGD